MIEGLEKHRPDPKLALNRGRLMIKAGKKQEGFAVLEAIVVANPDNVGILTTFIQQARALGHSDRALTVTERALKLAPSNVSLYRTRAALYNSAGKVTEAMLDLETAIQLEPEEPLNFRNRAGAYLRSKNINKALIDIDEALRMDPLNRSIIEMKATALRASGQGRNAIALYSRQLDRSRDGFALNNRCWERALSNIELDEAEADCAEALKLSPKKAGYWDSYALVAFRGCRFKEALDRYNQAIVLQPKTAASMYGRGLTKLRLGDDKGGREDLAAAKVINPKVDEELSEAGILP